MTKEQEEQFKKQWHEINKKVEFETIALKNKILKEKPWLFDYRNEYECLKIDIKRLESIGTLYIAKYPFSSEQLTFHIHSLCYAMNLCIYLFLQRYSSKAWNCGDDKIKNEFNYRFQIFIEFWNMDKHYDKQNKYKLQDVVSYSRNVKEKINSISHKIKNLEEFDILVKKIDFIQQDEYIEQLKNESKDSKYWFQQNKYLCCPDKKTFYKKQDKVPFYVNHYSLYKTVMDILDNGCLKETVKNFYEKLNEKQKLDLIYGSWKKFREMIHWTLIEIWSFFVNSTKFMETINNKIFKRQK